MRTRAPLLREEDLKEVLTGLQAKGLLNEDSEEMTVNRRLKDEYR